MSKTGPKRKYEFDREQLEEMYQRLSIRQIAEHFGCGDSIVWLRLKEFGVKFKDSDGKLKSGRFRKRPPRTEEHRQNLIAALKKIDRSGPNAPRWRGGVAADNLRARSTGAYKQWKIECRKRVGDRCEGCGIANGTMCECCGYTIKLHCHHIKSFAEFPESRFDPQNSEVLCHKCHNSRHNGKLG